VRRVKASISGAATCSATDGVASTRSSPASPRASRTARRAWSAMPRISAAALARRWPPGVSTTPPRPRTNSSSRKSRRRADTASDTAGSLTPSSRAAARTDPQAGDGGERAELGEGHLGDPLSGA
jgi:hypothetical protein